MNDKKHIKELIMRFSYPDEKHTDLLKEIDRIISAIVEQDINVGDSINKIEQWLGKPYVIIGEESDEALSWLYPAYPEEFSLNQFPDEWFYILSFQDKSLVEVEKRAYRLS